MKRLILRIFTLMITIVTILSCSVTQNREGEGLEMNIIPIPQMTKRLEGTYIFPKTFQFVTMGEIKNADFFSDYLKQLIPGAIRSETNLADLTLELISDGDMPSEGYQLEITTRGISIRAGDDPGLFYGIQSLRQLLPSAIEGQGASLEGHRIQAMIIADHPRFGWRGMHLDVSRHFFPAEFIKRYIDMIALHKMNVFHWHLTDDNGWRLEIKQYPKLTEICAWRVDREHEDWRKWSPIEKGEESTYGGFYTQDEVRDIIAYAADRQITVIPEIEMPGHSSEIFAAYPELSCRGELLDVIPGSYWPNEDIFCAGNDSVFTFLENVIDEVAELFPAKYIHIGGDEAAKTHWKTCPKCQARIQAEGLADEHELQSWFIQKMEQYILSKGKLLIGWDEILEGGLAPEATVMSWRGEAGGIAAAKAGHDVIMTPTSFVYFDYYQGDPETEPQAIGGYLPVQKVYSYEPIPVELDIDEHKYVLGAQANLWTEFVKTTQHAEYMVLPRMTALAEVLWSRADQRDWSTFHKRLQTLLPRFDELGWNYSPGSFLVEILPGQLFEDNKIEVDLISEQSDHDIHFTLDGTNPTLQSQKYANRLALNQDAQIRAAIFSDQKQLGRVSKRDFAFHLATGAETSYELKYHNRYKGGGDQGLVDGILGSDNFKDGTWQGFQVHDLLLTIDLGETQKIFKTEMNFLQSTPAWIFMPEYIEVSLSNNGTDWRIVRRVDNEVPEGDDRVTLQRMSADFPTESARFIKVLAKNRSVCPDWHAGAGGKAWIFCDEVIVR